MEQFNNYIQHKIAFVTYNMYEDSVKRLKSKDLPVGYYGHHDFCQGISIHFNNVNNAAIVNENELSYVNDITSKIITEIDAIYGINDAQLGVVIFDFFLNSEWSGWLKIISDTRKYFGV